MIVIEMLSRINRTLIEKEELPLPQRNRPVHKEQRPLNLQEPCLLCQRKIFPQLLSWNDERRFGIEECATRFQEQGDLPEQLLRVRHFVDNKYGEGGIEGPVQLRGKTDGVRLALVRRDPGQEAFRLQFPPQDPEHLLLQVYREDLPAVSDTSRKFPGEEPRPAAKVEHAVAWLDVPLRELIGTIEEPAQAGIEMTCPFSREDLVVVMFFGIFTGIHTEYWVQSGDNGSVRKK